MLCSVVKHAGSGRARKKCRGKHETQSNKKKLFSSISLPGLDKDVFLANVTVRIELPKQMAPLIVGIGQPVKYSVKNQNDKRKRVLTTTNNSL